MPFVGSYLFMLMIDYNHMHKAVDWLCKFYQTKVLGMYFGDTPTIVAYSADIVKASLHHRDFDGKPQLTLAKLREPDLHIRG